MKFKIKIMIIVSFVVIVSMSFFIGHNNSVSVSSIQPDNVITGSNNSYLITLKGVPSGNGTYQQLIIINNYSKYGINNNGSNIEFFDYSNYTHLYAWIQSINLTSMQVWIKNYNDSSKIDMQVLLKDKNLFSANGYLGKQGIFQNNGINVFPYFVYFYGNKIYQSSVGELTYMGTLSDNFLKINDNGTDIMRINNNVLSNVNSTIIFGENYDTGTLSNSVSSSIGTVGGSNLYLGTGFFNYGGEYGVIWTNNSLNSSLFLYKSNGGSSNVYYGSANMFENYMVNFYQSNTGYLYGYYFVNNTYKAYRYYVPSNIFSINLSEPVFWYTQQYSVAYSEYSYIAIMNGIGNNSMPIFTIGSSIYHLVDFKILGSPFSSLWNIMVNGTTYQADSSNIYLNMTNGYYNIIVNLPAGYSAITKGVLYVNGTNQVYKIFVSYNNNSGISNDIIYAIILASIIVAASIYFSKRS